MFFCSDVQYFIPIDEGVGTEVAVGLPFGGIENAETVGTAVADVDAVVARRAGFVRDFGEEGSGQGVLHKVLADKAVLGKAVESVKPAFWHIDGERLFRDDVAVEVEPHQLVHQNRVGGVEREQFFRRFRLRAARAEQEVRAIKGMRMFRNIFERGLCDDVVW